MTYHFGIGDLPGYLLFLAVFALLGYCFRGHKISGEQR